MSAYRSSYEHIIRARIAAMRLAREGLGPRMPQLRTVRNARIARMVSGAVGTLGACAMAISAAVSTGEPMPTKILLTSAVATVATYIGMRAVLAFSRLRMSEWRPPQLSGRLDADLLTLDASDSTTATIAKIDRLEMPSLLLPMAATTLLTPLTLHWLFTACCDSGTMQSFSWWIGVSLLIVGHAHLALIWLSYRFLRKMRGAKTETIQAMSIHQEWAKALGITIVVSAVPGIVLIAVPPILSSITGLTFVPLMFWLAREALIRERKTLTLDASPIFARVDAAELLDAPIEYQPLDEQRVAAAGCLSP